MIPVILSGGAGTRLWPLSTNSFPKQFLQLVGNDTMIKQTVKRVAGLSFISNPLVVCNSNHLKNVLEQLSSYEFDIMVEPASRNTAPALLGAAFYCVENTTDGIMLVLPSDHVILKEDVFRNCIALAYNEAKKNKYVLFGIVPSYPETGYGYIETKMDTSNTAFPVKAFKEKPSLEVAKEYVSAKSYFWNSGMFVIPAALFIEEMKQFNPEMYNLVREAYQKAKEEKSVNGGIIKTLDKSSFEKISGTSVDYAVMEKTKNAVVVPLDAAWSDVGSWNMVWELSEKDVNGNVNSGNSFFYESKNNLVKSQNNVPIALLGLDDCVVIESSNGIVVAKKDCVQAVKEAATFFEN